jgi:hypothetical protein
MLPVGRRRRGAEAGLKVQGEVEKCLPEASIDTSSRLGGSPLRRPLTSPHAAHPAAAQVPGHIAGARPCRCQRVSCAAAAKGVKRVPTTAGKGTAHTAAAPAGKGVTPTAAVAAAATKGVASKGICLLQAPAPKEVVKGAKAVQLLQWAAGRAMGVNRLDAC